MNNYWIAYEDEEGFSLDNGFATATEAKKAFKNWGFVGTNHYCIVKVTKLATPKDRFNK
jgi:hypothetical protein